MGSRDEQKTICKKVRYKNQISAMIALSKIFKNNSNDHDESRVYRCPDCKGFHTTKTKAPSWKDKR
jgi:hypothetical protein